MRQVSFHIGNSTVDYNIDGETIFGSDKVLLAEDDNLIADTPWSEQGYTVQKFFSPEESDMVRSGIRKQLLGVISQYIKVDEKNFSLDQYHHFVNDDVHSKITADLRKGFKTSEFPLGIAKLEKRVSEICGVNVEAFCPSVGEGGYFVRIVRPMLKTDNNPPHRDVWLDRLRNCVNIYFPIAGSNEHSALPVVPGSHLWKESDIERTVTGATVNTASYQVPSVTSWKKNMDFIRPNPESDEVMVFSPYTIHGGGINLNSDRTRMSLEARFWRKR